MSIRKLLAGACLLGVAAMLGAFVGVRVGARAMVDGCVLSFVGAVLAAFLLISLGLWTGEL